MFHRIIKRVDRAPHVIRVAVAHHVIRRGLHICIFPSHAVRRHGVVDDLQPRRQEGCRVGRAGRADLAGVEAVELLMCDGRLFRCLDVMHEVGFARVGAVVLLQWNALFSVIALAEPGLGFEVAPLLCLCQAEAAQQCSVQASLPSSMLSSRSCASVTCQRTA